MNAVGREAEPPPIELWLAWHVEQWGALPYGGGLLDQPAGLLDKMRVALGVYNVVQSFEGQQPGTKAAWVRANPGGWKTVIDAYGWEDNDGD